MILHQSNVDAKMADEAKVGVERVGYGRCYQTSTIVHAAQGFLDIAVGSYRHGMTKDASVLSPHRKGSCRVRFRLCTNVVADALNLP